MLPRWVRPSLMMAGGLDMRMVRVTIEYDMDDAEKPIQDELQDWLQGNVNVLDIVAAGDDPSCVTIVEIKP